MSERQWLAHYPEGIPHDINPDEYSCLQQFVKDALIKHPTLRALSNFGSSMTYKELNIASDNFASYLTKAGFKQGEHFALMMPNIMQYPIAVLGAIKAGMVLVNMDPTYPANELRHQLNAADVDGILTANIATKALKKAVSGTRVRHIIVTEIGDQLEGFTKFKINWGVYFKAFPKIVSNWRLPNAISFKKALAIGAQQGSYIETESEPNDLAYIQFTGGTTGLPKGAMLSHRNILANIEIFRAWLGDLSQQHTCLTPLPLNHVFSQVVNQFGALSRGAHNVLITDPRRIGDLVEAIEKYKIEAISGVDKLYMALAKNKCFQQLDFSHLKIAVGGATAVKPETDRLFHEITGVHISQGYGLTQCSPSACMVPLHMPEFINAIGLPLPSTYVELRDGEGNVVTEPGVSGECYIKGPQVFLGYYKNPKATAEELTDGWLKTGDIMCWNEQGYLEYLSRITDMINVGGKNVYPDEIEKVYQKHPDIIHVGCFGVPHRDDERVKLVIVSSKTDLDRKGLVKFAADDLAGYKLPAYIEFIAPDEYSRYVTTVGKAQRKRLQKREQERGGPLKEESTR